MSKKQEECCAGESCHPLPTPPVKGGGAIHLILVKNQLTMKLKIENRGNTARFSCKATSGLCSGSALHRLDNGVGLFQGFVKFFRLSSPGLGQVRPAAAAAADQGRQLFYDIAGFVLPGEILGHPYN